MAQEQDFAISYVDGVLTVDLRPPTNITNWAIQFTMTKRFYSNTPIITKSCASGYNNVSGINVTNAGIGLFNVTLTRAEVSGLAAGAYACNIDRVDSGFYTELVNGYRLLF